MSLLLGYIDPGTGAIMMQVIAAGIIGVGIFFRRFISSPLRFAGKLFSRGSQPDQDAGDQ